MSTTPEIDCDGFQLVKSKRFTTNKPTRLPPKCVSFAIEDVPIDIPKAIQQINAAVKELQASDYLNSALVAVSSILNNRKLDKIICLGLGHVSECKISKYQLAFLLCLKERYNPVKVLVHDPIFYKNECHVLKKLGLKVILKNKEGSYVIDDLTLVYLPHCPRQLTNNFLWRNWGLQLKNCILICNSFTSLIDQQSRELLLNIVPYIYNLYPYIIEIPLINKFKFNDVFNDTSLHYLIKNTDHIDSKFWIKGDKPTCNKAEEIITSQMVKKLKI